MNCHYEGWDIWVGRCMGTRELDPCIGYDKCEMFKPRYKSNADWLRGMTDKELAEWLCDNLDCGMCKCYIGECDNYGTPNKLIAWLKKEHKEENT